MLRSPLAFLCFTAAMLSLGPLCARTPQPPLPEPPLPDQDGKVNVNEAIDAFSLLPGPDSNPPEGPATGEENPVIPPDNPVMPPPEAANMDQLPDIEPLGLPSDGEAAPELPFVPGLTPPPRGKPASSAPRTNPNPVQPEAPSDLRPAPGIELVKRSMWYRSPIEARKVAIAQGKPLLLFFAQKREGDCPTVLLNDDLLTMPEFNDFASAKLILTMLQYPGVSSPNKRDYPEEKLNALKKFQDYFKVRGFPTLILIDETGRELKRIKGYRRISDKSGQAYSTAHVTLDQLKEATRLYDERRRYQQQRMDNLTSQGYRLWTSRQGSSMMGKLVDAKPERIVLMDEHGQWRQVLPSQLILFDAEWARRKQAGLIPVKPAVQIAAAEPLLPVAAVAAAAPAAEALKPAAAAAPLPVSSSFLPRVTGPQSRPGTLGGTPAGR